MISTARLGSTAAKQYAQSLRDQPTEGDRFYYGIVHDEPEISGPSDLAEGEEPPEQINLKLTALIKGRNLRVIVDGNVKQVGDEVDPGWTRTEIDPDVGAVTLCGPDGQTILLRGDVESLSSVGAVMLPKGGDDLPTPHCLFEQLGELLLTDRTR